MSVYLEKLAEFSGLLRREGLTVGLRETEDACRLLADWDLTDRETVRCALETVYAKSREEQAAFRRAFDGFFVSVERREALRRCHEEEAQALARRLNPACVIVVDALASRSLDRLCRTVQLSDAGVVPGSGVGNHRMGLTRDSLGVPVIGIGIPTVVDAATIVHDAMAHLLEALEEQERKEFLEEMISPHLHTMFVTPKDVDETVKRLGYTISEGLNMALEYV